MSFENYRFEIPEGTVPAKCRGCGAQIWWVKTKNDKNVPCNEDGSSHFSSCPQADKFRGKGAPTGPSGGMDRVKRLETMVEHLNERVNALEGKTPKVAMPKQERMAMEGDDALPF